MLPAYPAVQVLSTCSDGFMFFVAFNELLPLDHGQVLLSANLTPTGPTVWRLSIGLGIQFVAIEGLKDLVVSRRQHSTKGEASTGSSGKLSQSGKLSSIAQYQCGAHILSCAQLDC